MGTTGSRRRDVGKERRWKEVIRTQQGSGRSVREYCRQAGVKESAFYWWRRELARRRPSEKTARRRSAGPGRLAAAAKRTRNSGQGKPASRASSSQGAPSPFLPIRVLTESSAAGVEIHLGDGRMICVRPGFDRQTLGDVLAVLEDRSC